MARSLGIRPTVRADGPRACQGRQGHSSLRPHRGVVLPRCPMTLRGKTDKSPWMRPILLNPLFAPARNLKGVGPRIEGLLNRLVAPRHQSAHARVIDLL